VHAKLWHELETTECSEVARLMQYQICAGLDMSERDPRLHESVPSACLFC